MARFQERFRQKSVYYSFITSYVVILIIPLIFSWVIFFGMQRGIEAGYLNTSDAVLTQTLQTVDHALSGADSLYLDITSRDSVNTILYISRPFEALHHYNISQAVRALKRLPHDKAVSQYMVYFGRGDFVVNPAAVYEPPLAYETFFKDSGMDFESWHALMSGMHTSTVLDAGDSLLYIKSYPYHPYEAAANVAVLIDKQYLLSQVAASEWVSQAGLYILDEEGTLLLTNESREAFSALPAALTGRASGSYKGEGVYASVSVSPHNGWRYILVMDDQYMKKNMVALNWIYIGCIVAAVFIGFGLAMYFSKRNYSPIEDVAHALGGNRQTLSNENELAFINTSVKRMLNQNADINRRLALTQEQLTQNYLSRILRGRINLNLLGPQELQEYGVRLPHDSFLVALFKVDDFSGYFTDMKSDTEEYPLDNMEYSLIYLIRELVNEHHLGYVCEVAGVIACVLNFNEADSGAIFELLAYTQRFVAQKLYIVLSVAVSNLHKSMYGIARAYDEAGVALEGAMLEPGGRFFHYAEAGASSNWYYYPQELEQALAGSLRTGRFDAARELVEEIFRVNTEENRITVELMRCLVADVTATVVRQLDTLPVPDESLNAGIVASRILAKDSLSGAKEAITEVLRTLCAWVNSGKESHNSVLLSRILDYVRENYADSNLSNNLIAQEMNITASYLSRFFKQQTGDGVLSYINRTRVERAKELMLERARRSTLGDICAQVGFENTATFIRIFKKYEGITPGQYTELFRNKT